ncbi:MAG: serine protease [Ignavibacteria bacterium]|nr:serine protease [Ignavibacteria bacterium]
MNILDILILVVVFGYFSKRKNQRATHVLINAATIIAGYLIGFFISVNVVSSWDFDIDKGIVAPMLMFGLAFLFRMMLEIMRYIVRQIKNDNAIPVSEVAPVYKSINLRLEGYNQHQKTDAGKKPEKEKMSFGLLNKRFAVLCKILSLIAFIYIMSQTLFYIPIQMVQFTIQGSGSLMAAARLLPESAISVYGKQYSPNEFVAGKLDYSFDLSGSGEFKSVVNNVSESIVRIITEKCVGSSGSSGSGSVIAPGLAVTNQHVINGSSAIFIVNHNGSYPATIVSIDKDHDIAIIYSKYLDTKSRPIVVSSDIADMGSDAISVGYPSTNDGKFST